jgi:hypothetical protein
LIGFVASSGGATITGVIEAVVVEVVIIGPPCPPNEARGVGAWGVVVSRAGRVMSDATLVLPQAVTSMSKERVKKTLPLKRKKIFSFIALTIKGSRTGNCFIIKF